MKNIENLYFEEMPSSVDEEELVSHIHNYSDRLKENKENLIIYTKELELIHREISNCSIFPIYNKYKEGKIINFDILKTSIDIALDKISIYKNKLNIDDRFNFEDLEKTENLLRGRISALKISVESYAYSIERFYNLKKLNHENTRELKEQFSEADNNRRFKHESLIKSLEVLVELFEKVCKLDRNINLDNIVSSIKFLLRDRNLVRDWAISAYFYNEITTIRESKKK